MHALQISHDTPEYCRRLKHPHRADTKLRELFVAHGLYVDILQVFYLLLGIPHVTGSRHLVRSEMREET
jgi:hypothetical protein